MALDEQDMAQMKGVLEQLFEQQEKSLKETLAQDVERQVSEKVGGIANTIEGMLKTSGTTEDAGQGQQDMFGSLILMFAQKMMGLGQDKQPQGDDIFASMEKLANVHTLTRTAFIDPMMGYLRDGAKMMTDAIGVAVKSGHEVDLTKLSEGLELGNPAAQPANSNGKVDLQAEIKKLSRVNRPEP